MQAGNIVKRYGFNIFALVAESEDGQFLLIELPNGKVISSGATEGELFDDLENVWQYHHGAITMQSERLFSHTEAFNS